MKAARLVAPKRWEIAEVETPEPTDEMMLVRLERAGICGTDKPAFHGIGASYPMGLGQTGHEGSSCQEVCKKNQAASFSDCLKGLPSLYF